MYLFFNLCRGESNDISLVLLVAVSYTYSSKGMWIQIGSDPPTPFVARKNLKNTIFKTRQCENLAFRPRELQYVGICFILFCLLKMLYFSFFYQRAGTVRLLITFFYHKNPPEI